MRKSPVGNGLLLLAAALLFVAAIPTPAVYAAPSRASLAKGVYHRVKNGETLVGIARAYGIPVQTIAEANRIKTTARIEKDSVIFIPGAKRVIENTTPLGLAKREKARAAEKSEKKGKEKAKTPAKRFVRKEKKDAPPKQRPTGRADDTRIAPPAGARFIWPVKGRVVAKFGLQPGGMFYNGIRIAGRPDRPVVAVAPGVVIYSSVLKDYGETVIVKHAGQFATVYTNLGERSVALDNRVKQGSKIGLMGMIDGKNEGFMNFEIRYKNKAVNPLRYLK